MDRARPIGVGIETLVDPLQSGWRRRAAEDELGKAAAGTHHSL